MCCFVLRVHTRKLGKTSCTIHKKIKVNTSTNLMKAIHCMKVYCTQIWCSLLTHGLSLRRKLPFCFVQTLQPEGWISLPGGTSGLFRRCQYLSYRSTARYEEDEKRLLFLFLSEEVGILKALQAKKIDSNPGQSQENCSNSKKVGDVLFSYPRSRNKTLGSV